MKYISFFFCLTLILLFGCKKDDAYEISGQVVEYGTEEPIEGALVLMTDYQGGEIFGASGISVFIDSVRTDANGNYLLRGEGSAVDVYAFKDGYNERGTYEPISSFSRKHTNVTLTLDPYAWLDVTLKNVSGAHTLGFAITGSTHESVMKGDIFYKFQRVLGNRDVRIGMSKKDSIGLTDFSEHIYCSGQDTTFFYREY